ncbi:MAG TPA: tetratricopeptide repeat protein [Alphaproteobacteria bacterium]
MTATTTNVGMLRQSARIAERDGDFAAAERDLRAALAADSGDGSTVFALADFLARSGRFAEAEPLYSRLLPVFPNEPALLNSLAVLLNKTGRQREAIELWRKVHIEHPTLAQPLVNIGLALRAAGDATAAVAHFEQALAVDPNLFEAHYQLGVTYFHAKRRDEATKHLEAALQIKPDHARASVLLAQAYQGVCDWARFERMAPRLRREVDRAVAGKPCAITPWFALRLAITRPQRRAIEAAMAAQYAAAAGSVRQRLGFTRNFARKEKLTVGYMSADFHRHPILLLTAGLYGRHDRSRFRVHAYPVKPPDDLGTTILSRDCDKVVDLSPLSAEDAARAIYADGVDILVDLSGYNQFARPEIVALRPAPIQCSYFNPAAPLGGGLYDCVIADPVVIPPEHERDYREPIERLPHSFFINDYPRMPIGPGSTRAAEGLPEDRFVFCNFCSPDKVEAPVFQRWMNILRRCPDAVLWLFAVEPAVETNLAGAATAAGIDPQRLHFAKRRPHPDHLARLKLADLHLDTRTYNGSMTAADGLWMGLPLLTQIGDAFGGRAAAMMLRVLGLPELVVDSLDAYEELAVVLAHDRARLADVRRRLEANRLTSPLFDTAHYVRGLEGIYERLWAARTAG